MQRRQFLQTGLAAGAAALGGCGRAPAADAAPSATSEAVAAPDALAVGPGASFRQSVTRWPFPDIGLDDLARAARDLGLGSVELLSPDEWPVVQKYGLTCAMANAAGPGGIPKGFNRIEHHEWLIPAYELLLRQAADAGVPNVICFSGNRDGMSDAEGMENCARGLASVTPTAERLGVTIAMELLNSEVDHPDYMCDHTVWGVALAEKVNSPRFKLLYDIYHMQIMEGDVIRTIREHHPFFAHYHTAGVPGRHELDENQELFYPAIMRAIAETGFQGFVGQEFIPTGDPLPALAEAVRICRV